MMPDWLSIGGGHCGQEVEGYFSFFTSDWVIIPVGRLLQIEADAKLRALQVLIRRMVCTRHQIIQDGCEEQWTWNKKDKSHEVKVQGKRYLTAHFHPNWSNGTAGVRGSVPLNYGRHYWEIKVSQRIFGTSMMFGIGTRSARLHVDSFVNMLGEDEHSWGLSHKGLLWHNGQCKEFTKPFTENQATTLGMLFDWFEGTLTYFKDGVSLGVGFSGLNNIDEDLFPLVSSTAAKTEMTLGIRRRAYLSLQDRCRATILSSVKRQNEIDILPLPKTIKRFLKNYNNSTCSVKLTLHRFTDFPTHLTSFFPLLYLNQQPPAGRNAILFIDVSVNYLTIETANELYLSDHVLNKTTVMCGICCLLTERNEKDYSDLKEFQEVPSVGLYSMHVISDVVTMTMYPRDEAVWPGTSFLVKSSDPSHFCIPFTLAPNFDFQFDKAQMVPMSIPKLNKQLHCSIRSPSKNFSTDANELMTKSELDEDSISSSISKKDDTLESSGSVNEATSKAESSSVSERAHIPSSSHTSTGSKKNVNVEILEEIIDPNSYLENVLQTDELMNKLSDQLMDVLLKAVTLRVYNQVDLQRIKNSDGYCQQMQTLQHADISAEICQKTSVSYSSNNKDCAQKESYSDRVTCLIDHVHSENSCNSKSDMSEKCSSKTAEDNLLPLNVKHTKDCSPDVAGSCSESEIVGNARVAVLFSGGIDSAVITALVDRPKTETTETNWKVPDRVTGYTALQELNPNRRWNFIEVILCGMGADEQLAGYSRHRGKFIIITDHGKESRFPFIDENVVNYLQKLPIQYKADLSLPRGVGEKLLLRLCAMKVGLVKTATFPKRAIQFGSRIAKTENNKEKGSDKCQRLNTK
ncbi:SPSB3 [Mytilus edulis]|uniref:SPRY domain-containing SOCS box protein 3 n=1 Tax=Mytilus edulis TaxID=6550 RepID=A0A8S3SDJ0_MYTED|nr:SPSB3 [Mytilus edulis]